MFTVDPYYYSDKNNELDFVIQNNSNVVLVEVKAGEDKSSPSFKKYIDLIKPSNAIRYSKMGYRKDGLITNIPLYLVNKTKELI